MDSHSDPQQMLGQEIPEITPYLETLINNMEGQIAIHFYLSKLLPYDHQFYQALEVFSLLKQTFMPLNGKSFLLKNDDLVYISNNNFAIHLERCLSQFRLLLATDPFISNSLKRETFYASYPLSQKMAEFRRIVTDIEENPFFKGRMAETLRDGKGNSVPIIIEGINLERLAFIESSIKSTDISPFLKREPIVSFGAKLNPEIKEQHYFISLEALQDFLKINEPIANNIWLFRHIGFYLDKQILQSLPSIINQQRSYALSINLNLRTLITTYFQNFIKNYDEEQKLTFNVDVIDAIAHLDAFEYASQILWEKGCEIGLTNLALKQLDYLNLQKFNANTYRLIWSNNLMRHIDRLKEWVESIGTENIILAKCDSKTAIQTGKLAGIKYFHGHILDEYLRKKSFI